MEMYKGHTLGIVIPCHNEEALIITTLSELPDYVDRVYVIDDGSTDATSENVKQYENKSTCLICLNTQQGPGAATATGFKKALQENMDIIVKLDGDNQMDVKYLPALLDPIIDSTADYTKGNRLSRPDHRRGMSHWRYFGNWMLTLLNKIASGYWRINDPQNGYVAISQRALRDLDPDTIFPNYGYLNDILVKLNIKRYRIADIPMPARYGKEKSKIRYRYFISTVAPLLLRLFLRRIREKYLKRAHHTSDSVS